MRLASYNIQYGRGRDGVTATIDAREVRLDYCFVSASLSGAITAACIDGQAAGSDHQPLWVEIDLG